MQTVNRNNIIPTFLYFLCHWWHATERCCSPEGTFYPHVRVQGERVRTKKQREGGCSGCRREEGEKEGRTKWKG